MLCFLIAVIIAPDVWLSFLTKKSQENQKDKTNLIIFGCLVLGSFIFATIRAYGFLWASLRCSERLHDRMVVAILEAPVLFFDSNPVGRILNRFSRYWLPGRTVTQNIFIFYPVDLGNACVSCCTDGHKSLACIWCCSIGCSSRLHL